MARWGRTVRLADLWRRFDDGEVGVAEVARETAARVRALGIRDAELEDVCAGLDAVHEEGGDADGYDTAMERLYDWGDEGNRLWVDTLDR